MGQACTEKLLKLRKAEWLKGAVFAAVISAMMSCCVTYFVVGMPGHETANAINNALSGGVSGFMSALVATAAYLKAIRK